MAVSVQPPQLFSLAAAEIFRNLRLELIPRRRRSVPAVLFLHGREPGSGMPRVSSLQLSTHPRDAWPRAIALKVSQTEAEWWAATVELRLKVREEELETPTEDDTPDESSWLVVVVCSASEQQVWWSPLQRDEVGSLIEIEHERPMPPGSVREEVLQALGNRFYPLDA